MLQLAGVRTSGQRHPSVEPSRGPPVESTSSILVTLRLVPRPVRLLPTEVKRGGCWFKAAEGDGEEIRGVTRSVSLSCSKKLAAIDTTKQDFLGGRHFVLPPDRERLLTICSHDEPKCPREKHKQIHFRTED